MRRDFQFNLKIKITEGNSAATSFPQILYESILQSAFAISLLFLVYESYSHLRGEKVPRYSLLRKSLPQKFIFLVGEKDGTF